MDKLEQAKLDLKKHLKTGCAFVVLLIVILAILGGGLLAKNSLSVFLFTLGLALGVVGGFFGWAFVMTYMGVDEEIKKMIHNAAIKSEGQEYTK